MTRTATAILAAMLLASAASANLAAASGGGATTGAAGGPESATLPEIAGATGGTAAPEPGLRVSRPDGAADQAALPGAARSSLTAGRAALYGRRQRIAGRLDGAGAGRQVLVQRSDRAAGWVTIARTRTGPSGRFAVVWRADRIGRLTLRAVGVGAAAAAAGVHPSVRVTVYLAAIATHYGAGFYGTRTACGTILRPATLGVAHRTLPCGTLVELHYRGRTIRAPVIDRGPYANHADWDLTMPTSRALGFSGKDYVGAIRIGRAAPR